MTLTVNYSFIGNGDWSLDAISGTATGGGVVEAFVPVGATVEAAFLYASGFFSPTQAGDLQFAGTTILSSDFVSIGAASQATLTTFRADITDLVDQLTLGGDAAPFDFLIESNAPSINGYALAVVYSDPNALERTIVFADGFSDPDGDNFAIQFTDPVDTTQQDFSALMSLGIGHGSQGPGAFGGPTSQFSEVTVNNRLLTSFAGGQDDGVDADGGLITIGGLGDDPANPLDPAAQSPDPRLDDELYDLAQGNATDPTPFLANNASTLNVFTRNESDNDNIFFAGFNVTSEAVINSDGNDRPTALDDAVTLLQDDADTPIAVTANDLDPDGDPLTVVAVDDTGTAGAVTLTNGRVSYSPNGAFNGLLGGETETDTFTYTVADPDGLTSSATVTVTVENPNDAPVANEDAALTDQDVPVTIDVLANDTDADGDPLDLGNFTQGTNGTVALDNNGTPGDATDDRLVYTPNAGFSGSDTFTYGIADPSGATDTGTVTVTVNATAQVGDPQALGDAIVVSENEGPGDLEVLVGGATSVLSNDVAADGSPYAGNVIEVNGVAGAVGTYIDLPEGGRIRINADGTVDFDADGDFSALDDGQSETFNVGYSIQGANTTVTSNKQNILFVVDVSGSTFNSFGGTPIGDTNNDGNPNSILDAEIESYLALLDEIQNQIASSSLTQADVDIGLISFDDAATIVGTYAPSDPTLRTDLRALREVGGLTNFEAALDRGLDWFAGQGATTADRNTVFFLSDGFSNQGGTFTDEAQALVSQYNATINAVGVGQGADKPQLDSIDADGNAQIVTTTDALTATLVAGGALIPGIAGNAALTITVEGSSDGTLPTVVINRVDEVNVEGNGQNGTLNGSVGNETFQPSIGVETLRLLGGDDIVAGTLEVFDGDVVQGFSQGDMLLFESVLLPNAAITVSNDPSPVVEIDADGDGTVDSSFVLESLPATALTSGAFVAARAGSNTEVTLQSFLPDLTEGARLFSASINGDAEQPLLNGTHADGMTVTFESDADALLDNSVGFYEYTDTGEVMSATMLAANTKTTTGPITVSLSDPGNSVGFFLVQNGANRISAADFAADDFEFIANGTGYDLASQGSVLSGLEVFFSHDATLNSDGAVHVVTGLLNDGSGALQIGFEDLLRPTPSDDDFQDVIMTLNFV